MIGKVPTCKSVVLGFGETRPGSRVEPNGRSILRVGSIAKVMAGHALASDYAWSFTSANSSAPTITATFSPAPNAAGWNTGNVTATFTCADDVGIAVCTPPLQVAGEGAGIPVTGTATDTTGNSTTSAVPSLEIQRMRSSRPR